MFEFDPQNPIPLSTDADTHLQAEQAHAEKLDLWLGFQIDEIEARLSARAKQDNLSQSKLKPEGQNFWIDLPPRTLMTPYTEILRICKKLQLQPKQTVIDLGAAYGRMGFVLHRYFPEVNFLGYESVRERAEEGNRLFQQHNCSLAKLIHADLTSDKTEILPADVYFIYDFGSSQAICNVLETLRQLTAKNGPITMVGRGIRSRDMIEKHAPWLSQVHKPVHFAQYSLYSSYAREFDV